MDNVQIQIKQLLFKYLGTESSLIKNEHSFVDDLKANSLDMMEIIIGLEDHFSIEINDEEAQKLITVQDAILLVLSKTNNKIV